MGVHTVNTNTKQIYTQPLPNQQYNHPNHKILKTPNKHIFIATAYTLACGNGDGYTATMSTPLQGRTIAVDPSIIPYGTKLTINGKQGYIAEDCGGAIKGKHIDIFFNSYHDAITFGKQKVVVEYN